MSEIDRKRIAAVRVLEAMNYHFDGVSRQAPSDAPPWPEADRLHALLMERAEALAVLIEDSPEEDELKAIAEALETYEAQRWPMGKIAVVVKKGPDTSRSSPVIVTTSTRCHAG